MIKAVIFDVGGVLKVDTDMAIRQDVVTTLGILPEAFEEPWQSMTDQLGRGVIAEAAFWQQIHALTHATHPLPSESLLMRAYVKGHKLTAGVAELAQRLREAGYVTAILSNTNVGHANFNREHGVYDGFEPVILSHEIGLRKPEPEIFTYALNALKLKPDEAVMIDDLEKNIAGAVSVGMHAILFKDSVHLEEELTKLGVSLTG